MYLQLKFDEIQNNYLTLILVFLAGVELKNKLLPEKIELTLLLWKSSYYNDLWFLKIMSLEHYKFVRFLFAAWSITIYLYIYLFRQKVHLGLQDFSFTTFTGQNLCLCAWDGVTQKSNKCNMTITYCLYSFKDNVCTLDSLIYIGPYK